MSNNLGITRIQTGVELDTLLRNHIQNTINSVKQTYTTEDGLVALRKQLVLLHASYNFDVLDIIFELFNSHRNNAHSVSVSIPTPIGNMQEVLLENNPNVRAATYLFIVTGEHTIDDYLNKELQIAKELRTEYQKLLKDAASIEDIDDLCSSFKDTLNSLSKRELDDFEEPSSSEPTRLSKVYSDNPLDNVKNNVYAELDDDDSSYVDENSLGI